MAKLLKAGFVLIISLNANALWAEGKRSKFGSRSLLKLAQLTEENSPNIARAKAAAEMARLRLANARSVFYPSLDISATHGVQDASPRTKSWPTPFTSQMDLTVTENIWDNGVSFTRLRLAQLEADRLQMDYEYQRDSQLLSVALAYLDWSALVKQREIDEEKRDLLRRQAYALQGQFKQGLKTKRDVLRIESEIRRLEMVVIGRDNDVDLNFQKLASAVGMTREELDGEDIEREEPKPYANLEENPPPLKAESHRRAEILDFTRKQAELEVRLAKLDYWPQVFVTGGLGVHLRDYLDTAATWGQQKYTDWSALVVFKYNIWDFGIRSRAKEVAAINVQAKINENRQAVFSLANDLRDVSNQLKVFRENVKLCRELLVLEQQSYSILEEDYRAGRANYLDLITNLNSWIDARSRFAAAYYGLKTQQMKYAFHKGNLHDLLN